MKDIKIDKTDQDNQGLKPMFFSSQNQSKVQVLSF